VTLTQLGVKTYITAPPEWHKFSRSVTYQVLLFLPEACLEGYLFLHGVLDDAITQYSDLGVPRRLRPRTGERLSDTFVGGKVGI